MGRAAAAEVLAAAEAAELPAAVPGPPAAAPVPRELPADVSAFTGRTGELAATGCPAARGHGAGRGAGPGNDLGGVGNGRSGQDRTGRALGAPGGRALPRWPALCQPARFRPRAAISGAGGTGRVSDARWAATVPQGEAAQAARYRSLLAGKRLLMLLDNAAIRGTGAAAAARQPVGDGAGDQPHALPGLVARDGARRLDLDLLPAGDAVALLRALIGERVDADPEAARRWPASAPGCRWRCGSRPSWRWPDRACRWPQLVGRAGRRAEPAGTAGRGRGSAKRGRQRAFLVLPPPARRCRHDVPAARPAPGPGMGRSRGRRARRHGA